MTRGILHSLFVVLLIAPIYADNETVTEVLKGAKYVFYTQGLSRDNYSRITYGVLARNTDINAGKYRLTLAAGKQIGFYGSGAPAIVYMTKNRTLPVGQYRLTFRGDMPLNLYESGTLESGYLARTHSLKVGTNTVPFKTGIDEIDRIEFHTSGRIRIGMLAKPTVISAGGKSYVLTERIGFYESGRVEFGHLAKDTAVTVGTHRLMLTGGEYHNVEFYENGDIMKAYLAHDQQVNAGGSPVTLSCTIEFQKGGRISMGSLAKDFSFQGRTYGQFDTVTFSYDKTGTLVRVTKYQHPHR